MKEIIDKFIDRLSAWMIALVAGLIIFVIAAANGVTTPYFSFGQMTPASRVLLGVVGWIVMLVAVPIYLEERKQQRTRPEAKLYTFQGLKEELRSESTFQNFEIDKQGGNVNAVYYLWADADHGSEIKAAINRDEKEPFLRVYFVNQPGDWACNLAIRAKEDKALNNLEIGAKEDKALKGALLQRYLCFAVRIPMESKYDDPLGIAVRVVDANLQHWQYAQRSGEYLVQKVDRGDWQTKCIDLEDSKKWKLFDSDGNHTLSTEGPDFSIIQTVIFELGRIDAARVEGGKGLLDFSRVYLSPKD